MPYTTPPTSWLSVNEPATGGQLTALSACPSDPTRLLVSGDLLSVGLSTDAGTTWKRATGFRAYEIAETTWHPTNPTTVWAGTVSGPYVSFDSGATWTERRSGFPAASQAVYTAPIQCVRFDPSDSTHLLAFGGNHRRWGIPLTAKWGAVWESHDSGSTWTQINSGSAVDGKNIMSAVWITTSTVVVCCWTALTSTQTQGQWTGGLGVYVSTDGGVTWAASNTGLPHLMTFQVVRSAGTGTLYLSLGPDKLGTNTAGGIYKSTNNGTSWSNAGTGLPNTVGASDSTGQATDGYMSVGVYYNGSADLLLTASMRVNNESFWTSANGGTSWTQRMNRLPASPAVQPIIPFGGANFVDSPRWITMPTATTFYVACLNTLYKTTDAGVTWADAMDDPLNAQNAPAGTFKGRGFAGFVSTRVHVDPITGALFLAGFDAANPLVTLDGTTWRRPFHAFGADTTYNANGCIDFCIGPNSTFWGILGQGPAPGFEGIAIGQIIAGAFVAQSISYSGHPSGSGLPTRGAGGWTVTKNGSIDCSQQDPLRAYALLGGLMYRTTDGGTTWTQLSTATTFTSIAVNPTNDLEIWWGDAAGLGHSTDGGTTRTLIAGGPLNITRIVLHPTDRDRVYMATYKSGTVATAGLWVYHPSSGTFTKLYADAQLADVTINPNAPNHLVVTTADTPGNDVTKATGLYHSTDGGTNWSSLAGPPLVRAISAAFDQTRPGRIYVSTYGGGTYAATFGAADFATGTVTVAGDCDFRTIQGDRFYKQITATSGGVAVALTGYTVRMMVRQQYSDTTPVLSISTATTGISLTDPTNGIFTIDVSAVTMATVPPGSWKYDLELVPAGVEANAWKLLKGRFDVVAEATK